MDNKASLTALMSAFARAYHAENNAAPVFEDRAARKLMTDAEYEGIKKYIIGGADFFATGQKTGSEKEILDLAVDTQLSPTPLARARFCEDSLRTAMAAGVTQYVILGAGLDTFSWREPEMMKELRVFEVDHPLTQADKRERLGRAGMAVPDGLRFVPVDLGRGGLREGLLEQGFDVTRKTFFSWLGVSYYLGESDVAVMLGEIASFASEGSTLLFDYADEGLFGAKEGRVRNMLAMAAAGGEPMRFCAGEMALTGLLERYSFLIYEDLSPEEIDKRYFSGRSDGMRAFEHIRYAVAVIKGTPFINTKEKILQTALKLFAQSGYEAVSVKDIADGLSLTKAAIYKHYGSKRDIFDKIVGRMEQQDAQRARAHNLPERPPEETPSAYRRTRMEDLIAFTEAQFRYWTEDPFACRFRRMLTLEQYRSPEMAALYRQYLCGGPLGYSRELLAQLLADPGEAEQAAVELYAPIFLLYALYDGEEDKAKSLRLLRGQLERFAKRFAGEEK